MALLWDYYGIAIELPNENSYKKIRDLKFLRYWV